MKQVCRIGLDIAKHKFQVHAVDEYGKDIFNKQLNRKDVLSFLPIFPSAWWGWKPAAVRITGGERYKNWGIL